jgi:RNA polymerase sigma-70 factor (ECF subfamily)
VDAEQYADDLALQHADTPEGEALASELEAAVQKAIAGLPEELRTALMLREFDGLSYEDIAVVMQCPVGTVRSRIFRAREEVDRQISPWLEK